MRKLIIRVDATPQVGMGHAVRTAALVESLRDSFEPVLCGTDDKLNQAFHNIPHMPLEEALKDDQAIILVDHPLGLSAVPETAHPKIMVDDHGNLKGADLVLNGTVTAGPTLYPELQDPDKLLLGPDFVLLRQPFGESSSIERKLARDMDEEAHEKPSFFAPLKNFFFAPPRKSRSEAYLRHQKKIIKKYDILIIAGSGQKARDWVYEMTQLFGEWNIAIVVGAQFAGGGDFGNHPVFQNLTAEPLTSLMRQSKIALVTGGMILYECLAAGIPVVAFPSVANMVPEIDRLEDLGIIDNIGNIKDKPRHVRSLLMNKEFLAIRAKKGMKLVDGLGTKRAAQIIKDRYA